MNSQKILSLLGLEQPVMNLIPAYIEAMDIFPRGDERDFQRKVAYHIANPEYIPPLYIEEVSGKIYPVSPLEALYASVWLKKEIVVYLVRPSLLASQIVGENISVQSYEPQAELNLAEIVKAATQWDNEAYILNMIDKADVSVLAKNIAPEFWRDQSFLNRVLTINPEVFLSLEPESGQNEEFLNFFIEQSKNWTEPVESIWKHFYQNLFAHSRRDEPVFAHTFSQKMANQERIMINIMKNSGPHYLKKLYRLASPEVKINPEVMSYLFEASRNAGEVLIDIKDIPDTFFEDKENVLAYMENLATNVIEREKNTNVYKSWIGNEEILHYLLGKLKGTSNAIDLLHYLPLTPAPIRYNINLMQDFIGLQSSSSIMSSNSVYYDLLPEELQKTPEILLANVKVYINSRDGIPGWLEKKLKQHLPQIKLEAYISREEAQPLLKIAPEIMLGLPQAWKADLQFLVDSKSLLDKLEPYNSDKTSLISRLYKKENQSALKSYLSYHRGQYYSLPMELRNDRALAYFMLEAMPFHYKIEFTPGNWVSEDFCVRALTKGYYEGVPEGFWSKTSFLKKVCEKLDNEELDLKSLTGFLPAQTSQFFDLLEKGQYVQSFDKMCLGEMLKITLNQSVSNLPKKKKI